MKTKSNMTVNQINFEERLKNNKMRVIQHQRDKNEEDCHCRNCSFSDSGKNMLALAKKHSRQTGHTIDVYYETWREVTYYNKTI